MFRSTIAGILAAALSFAPVAQACTGIRLIAKDGGVVAARSLEFGFDLHSEVMVSRPEPCSPARCRTAAKASATKRNTASSAPTPRA